MFAHNTVKIVDYQHIKFCKVHVGNTDVFLGGTRQGNRGGSLGTIGILSLSAMKDVRVSSCELLF